LTQAELLLLLVPSELPGVPEDEGEELDTDDDDETEGAMEEDGLEEGEGA
jgi:hypothetical protein